MLLLGTFDISISDDANVIEKHDIILECSTSANVTSISWKFKGKLLKNTTESNITLPIVNAKLEDAGTYTCNASDGVKHYEKKVKVTVYSKLHQFDSKTFCLCELLIAE